MTYEKVTKALNKLVKEEGILVIGKYDPKSDDMTGSYWIDGKETYIPFPCSVEQLYSELYWGVRQYWKRNANYNLYCE